MCPFIVINVLFVETSSWWIILTDWKVQVKHLEMEQENRGNTGNCFPLNFVERRVIVIVISSFSTTIDMLKIWNI